MALVARTLILGNRLYFARDGADDGGTPTADDHKPETASAAYEELGVVEAMDVSNKVEVLRLKKPSSGKYKLRKTIPLSQELMLKCTMQDYNQLAFESIFLLAGAITIATAQQPLKQSTPITGWLKVSQADQTDTAITAMFLWVELSVKQLKTAEKEYKYELEVEVLDNALNTFNLLALTAN